MADNKSGQQAEHQTGGEEARQPGTNLEAGMATLAVAEVSTSTTAPAPPSPPVIPAQQEAAVSTATATAPQTPIDGTTPAPPAVPAQQEAAPPAAAVAAPLPAGAPAQSAGGNPPSADLQNLIIRYRIDVDSYPAIANYNVQDVEVIISYLEQLGVNVQRVVQRYPAVFAGAPRRNVVIACEGVVQLLRNNGVNVVRAIEGYPNVLRLRIDTLQRTMDAITAVGHTVADVVHRYPNIFRLSEGDIDCMLRIGPQRVPQPQQLPDPRVELFTSLGLNAYRLLKKAPGVLGCTYKKLMENLDYLASVGVDVRRSRVVYKVPGLLERGLEALQQGVQFLTDNRLNAVIHINRYPTLLTCSVENNLGPTRRFLMDVMGLTTDDLNRTPNLWGYSWQKRLLPRFLYLQSENIPIQTISLFDFGFLSDANFATRLAGTDLHRYYAWRLQNGFSLPGDYQPVAAAAQPPADVAANNDTAADVVDGAVEEDASTVASNFEDREEECDDDHGDDDNEYPPDGDADDGATSSAQL
eukprot:EG_transcript_6376